ncbi:MAG: ATP-binding cassette domain-containing protein [Arenicellales bacterium]
MTEDSPGAQPQTSSGADAPEIDRSIYRYVLRYTLRGQLFLLLLTALTMPLVYISLDIPKRIINQAIGGVDMPDQILGFGVDQVSYLLALSVAFLLVVVISGALKFYLNVYKGVLGERMLRRFRFDLYTRILRFPSAHIRRTTPAEIIPMITAETEPLGGLIGDAVAAPAFQGALLLTYLSFIFQQDIWLGLASIALYPPQMYLIPKLQAKVNALAKTRVQTVRSLAGHIGETVQGATDIHANDSGRFERAKTSNQLGRIFDIREELYRRKFFIKFLNNILAQITPFFFFSIGGYLVIQGDVSLGALVAVLAAYKDIGPPWKELLKFYQVFEDTRVKYEHVAKQFEPENMIKASILEDRAVVESLKGTLTASNVSYGEDEDSQTVSGASFSMPLDTHVAVVGGAGSGKSHLAGLVARVLWPTVGRLSINDLDWSKVPEAVPGRRVAWVGSSAHIFSGTISHNLYYGLMNSPQNLDPNTEDKAEQRRLREALASGNSTDSAKAPWLDLAAGNLSDERALLEKAIKVLAVVQLDEDGYRFGLGMHTTLSDQDDIRTRFLKAREQILAKGLEFVAFDPDIYNANITVAENILFGNPDDPAFDPGRLPSNPLVTQLLRDAGLFDDFLVMGHKVAATMVEIFSGVSPDSELFEQFSLVSSDDLVVLERILQDTPDTAVSNLAQLQEADQEILRALVYRLSPARHRLGIIDESVQQRLLKVRGMLRDELGSDNDSVTFLDAQAFNPGLNIESNVLFGAMPFGKPAVRETIRREIDEAIVATGLREYVIELGLTADVGNAGGRLSSIQRQKLVIARALMKDPDLLVVDEALGPLDLNARSQIIKNVCEFMSGRGVLWVLETSALAREFENVIVMGSGRILEQGKAEALEQQNGPFKALLTD